MRDRTKKRMSVIIRISMLFFFCCFLCGSLRADDVAILLRADKKSVSLNETFVITVSVTGARNGKLDTAFMKPFSIVNQQQSTNFTMVQMKTRITRTYQFEVMPKKMGTVTLGPAIFTINGKKYKSNTLRVAVKEKSSGKTTGHTAKTQKGEKPEKESIPSTHARLVVERLSPTDVYVNQPVTLRLSLLVRERIAKNFRDISFPEIKAENCTIRNPEEGKRIHARRKIIGNDVYHTWTFNRVIIPVAAGELNIEALQNATLAVPVRRNRHPFGGLLNDDFFDDFFTRYRKQEVLLQTKKRKLNVSAFPEENKPKHFEGAVGCFTMKTQVSGKSVRVGEPLTMTVEISGSGNVESVNEPRIMEAEAFKVFQENPDVRKNSSDIMAGKKTFSITLVPQTQKITQTPLVVFSFFDPNKKAYQTLRSKRFPLMVQALEKESIIYASDQRTKKGEASIEVLTEDIVPVRSLKRNSGIAAAISPTSLKMNLIVFLVPLLVAASVRMLVFHRQKLESDPSYSRKLNAWKNARMRMERADQAINKDNFSKAAGELWDAIHLFAADRLSLSPGTVYGSGFVKKIQERCWSAELVDSVKQWSGKMEQIRFSGSIDKVRAVELEKETESLLNRLRKVI